MRIHNKLGELGGTAAVRTHENTSQFPDLISFSGNWACAGLLVLVLALLVPQTRGAVNDTFEVEGLNYRVLSENPNTVELTSCTEMLETAQIPPQVTYAGSEYSVTSVGSYAFAWRSELKSVDIPDSVTSLGDGVFFESWRIESIAIGIGVGSMGSDVFGRCSSLTQIDVDEANTVYMSLDGVLFNEEGTILFRFPGGKAGTYTVPDGVLALITEPF